MSTSRRRRTAGAGILEFTLVGIPLIFVLISTFEMARGMWMYHTLAAGIKAGVRYAGVHGQNCGVPPNTCTVTISQIATKIQTAGPGLSSDVTLAFTDNSGSTTTCALATCISSYTTAAWPVSTQNAPGLKIKIKGIYAWRSALAMFWPGAGGAWGPSGIVNLSAVSKDNIQF
jgi:Flp pilus assembly protein TadG